MEDRDVNQLISGGFILDKRKASALEGRLRTEPLSFDVATTLVVYYFKKSWQTPNDEVFKAAHFKYAAWIINNYPHCEYELFMHLVPRTDGEYDELKPILLLKLADDQVGRRAGTWYSAGMFFSFFARDLELGLQCASRACELSPQDFYAHVKFVVIGASLLSAKGYVGADSIELAERILQHGAVAEQLIEDKQLLWRADLDMCTAAAHFVLGDFAKAARYAANHIRQNLQRGYAPGSTELPTKGLAARRNGNYQLAKEILLSLSIDEDDHFLGLCLANELAMTGFSDCARKYVKAFRRTNFLESRSKNKALKQIETGAHSCAAIEAYMHGIGLYKRS